MKEALRLTYFDLIQFMKTYQTFVYTGNRQADLDLLEEEVRELRKLGLVDQDFFIKALLVIRKERK